MAYDDHLRPRRVTGEDVGHCSGSVGNLGLQSGSMKCREVLVELDCGPKKKKNIDTWIQEEGKLGLTCIKVKLFSSPCRELTRDDKWGREILSGSGGSDRADLTG